MLHDHGSQASLHHFIERGFHAMILVQFRAARLIAVVRECDPARIEGLRAGRWSSP